ncbi:hypothetical protein HG530_011993 [Fusarium avenaceum]|nr:hypothetical protein HG530_011993 [Fusarium avenaceum]
MGDETSTDQGSDKSSQVRSDGAHTALEVRGKLGSVVRVDNNLVSQKLDVLKILIGDLSTHADLGGSLDLNLDLLGEDLREIGVGDVGSHANSQNDASVSQVVVENLGHFGEVPSVPLLGSHSVNVKLLVKIVEELDSLNDHRVDLVGRELELVTRHGVRETESHAVKVLLNKTREKVGHSTSNTTEEIHGVGARDRSDVDLLLGLEVVEELGKKLRDLTLLEGGSFLESSSGAVELDKLLELEPVMKEGVSECVSGVVAMLRPSNCS